MSAPFLGLDTIYGVDPEDDAPYMTRAWLGRLRLHIFHRGDLDRDCHDHPWSFFTFPLIGYWEEVLDPATGETRARPVYPFRLHYRPAEFAHRVLCGLSGKDRIITVVWRGGERRKWGFWRIRPGEKCWVPWRRYVFEGGKHAPCEEASAR